MVFNQLGEKPYLTKRKIPSVAEFKIPSVSSEPAHATERASACSGGLEAEPPAGSGVEPWRGVRVAEPPEIFLKNQRLLQTFGL